MEEETPVEMETSAPWSLTPCGAECDFCTEKIHELFSKAQLLLRELEELLDEFTSAGPSKPKRSKKIRRPRQARVEEDGETLVIEGFRFESASSREELSRQSEARRGQMTDGHRRGSITPGQQGQRPGRANGGTRRANK